MYDVELCIVSYLHSTRTSSRLLKFFPEERINLYLLKKIHMHITAEDSLLFILRFINI